MTLRGGLKSADDRLCAQALEPILCSSEVTGVARDAIDPLIRRATGVTVWHHVLDEIWENAVTAAFEYLLGGAGQ